MNAVRLLLAVSCVLFMAISTHAKPLEMPQLEQQVVSQTQAQYSAKTQFLLALEDLQISAQINGHDGDGFINGVFDLAEKYEAAVRGHSELYTLELYSYMNRRLAVPARWKNGTVVAYVIKSLRKKAKHAEFSVQKRYLKIANQLSEISKLERVYFPVVSEVAVARARLANVEMSYEIAQAQVRREDLNTPYLQDVANGLKHLVRLGKALDKADESVLKMIGEGFKQDPLKAIDTPINVEKFLAKYGRYAYSQDDGSIIAEIGYKMLELEQQPPLISGL